MLSLFKALNVRLLQIIEDVDYPSKHEALTQCRADVDRSSTTLTQHQPNIGSTPRVSGVPVVMCYFHTRRQINLYRMFFVDFSVNSQPILMKFCKDFFHQKILYSSKVRPFDM